MPGGRAARRESRHRGAAHGHLLDQGHGRDDRGGDVRAPGGQPGDDVAVQPLAPVHQGEERKHLGPGAAQVFDERGELVEGALGQSGRDQRHEQHVHGVQDILRNQRDARRAVQEHDVVLAGQRAEHAGQPPRGPLGLVERQVHVAVGEVGG